MHAHYGTMAIWQFIYCSQSTLKAPANGTFRASGPSLGFEPPTRGIYALCITAALSSATPGTLKTDTQRKTRQVQIKGRSRSTSCCVLSSSCSQCSDGNGKSCVGLDCPPVAGLSRGSESKKIECRLPPPPPHPRMRAIYHAFNLSHQPRGPTDPHVASCPCGDGNAHYRAGTMCHIAMAVMLHPPLPHAHVWTRPRPSRHPIPANMHNTQHDAR